jgi:UDP-N-acetylglucosamine 2-epimerase (non-hydrolysing)
MIIDLVVGCRPNFVKAAAIIQAAKKFPRVHVRLLHTGQHPSQMSDPIWYDLDLPEPDWHGEQTSLVSATGRLGYMVHDLAEMWQQDARIGLKPDYVMVVGDTDSTLAGALAAKKSGLKLVHVEAGLRSGALQMQEEINRKLIDPISDVLYTSVESATKNLLYEGRNPWEVVFVGNVMADTLLSHIAEARRKYPKPLPEYAMLTLHRAENINNKTMDEIIDAVGEVSNNIPVIFPRHPRGHVRLYAEGLKMVPPMGYLEFIATMSHAKFVMTDSGGVQEETTLLGIPCVTIRPNTERPETVHQGTNRIAGTDGSSIVREAREANKRWYDMNPTPTPPLWDGKAAERILHDLVGRS